MTDSVSPGDPLVLVVEDDENLRITLADNLEDEGYRVRAVDGGRAALEAVEHERPDVVVLDIMLPDVDGYAVCRSLRQRGLTAKVLMLTARTLEDDVVQGFDAGADDYLAKPYRLRELLARVRALLRRGTPRADTSAPALPGLAIDRDARTVTVAGSGEVGAGGRAIDLTRTEFDLLVFLVDNPGKALSRDTILEKVWGSDVVVDPRTVDNFVSNLKRKLGWTAGCGYTIKAVRGVGYRLELDAGQGS
ncbi:response regulator transcription factor [Paraliomyxa miuraensis]|uniref:response regulator transcription factor n=1 Tax=Paraliomyxa miuraensis TaxID=376150 RepID=UPI0022519D38|nr:response regulator transcription factor [Paraliomyxa miuraensis]MCX4240231.1 response regulator transcription factor [Paraliomyxa miuraensis]